MTDKKHLKLDIDSFNSVEKQLDLAGFGAYSRLVFVFLDTKKSLKESDFERILNVNLRDCLSIKEDLIQFFDVSNGSWTPKINHVYDEIGAESE